MPTFVLPYSPPPVFVSAVKSDVFPLAGRADDADLECHCADSYATAPKPTRLSRAQRFTYTTRRSDTV